MLARWLRAGGSSHHRDGGLSRFPPRQRALRLAVSRRHTPFFRSILPTSNPPPCLFKQVLSAYGLSVVLLRRLLRLPPLDAPLPAKLVREAAPAAAAAGDAEAGAAGAAHEEGIEVVHLATSPAEGTDSEVWRRLRPYLRAHGRGALAVTTLHNPEFKHMLAPGVGSQAYIVHTGYNRTIVVAIGDPLAAEADWPAVAGAFLAAFPHAMFSYVSARYAAVLRDRFKMSINDLGGETTVRVDKFAYGKRTRTIKNGARDARAAGVRVREVREVTPALRAELADVAGEWMSTKAVSETELRVFIRAGNYAHLCLGDGVRLLVAEAPPAARAAAAAAAAAASAAAASALAGEDAADVVVTIGGDADAADAAADAAAAARPPRTIDGFLLLDPMFENGRLAGYVVSLNRMRPEAHGGTLKLLYDEAMALMRREGAAPAPPPGAAAGGALSAAPRELAFGLAPFFNLRKDVFRGVWWTELTFRYWYHCGNSMYDFKNLAFSKARYGGGVAAGGDRYHDADAVALTHVYMASRATAFPGVVSLDLYVFLMAIGFVGSVARMWYRLVFGSRGSGGGSGKGNGAAASASAGAAAAAARAPAGGKLRAQLSGRLSGRLSGLVSGTLVSEAADAAAAPKALRAVAEEEPKAAAVTAAKPAAAPIDGKRPSSAGGAIQLVAVA